MSILDPTDSFVVHYPEAVDFTEKQLSVFWLPTEIKVEKDVHDIYTNLTKAEKHGVLTVLKLFSLYELFAGRDYWTGTVMVEFPRPEIQRMAAPGPTDMLTSPVGPTVDAIKQIGAVGKAIADPGDKQNVTMAAMKVLPGSLPGLAETTVFKDETSHPTQDGKRMYLRGDLNDRTAGYERTPEEENIRKFGLRSQREVLNNDLAYSQTKLTKETAERSKDLPGKWYDAFRDGDMKRANEVQNLYLRLNDKPLDTTQYVKQLQQEYQTQMQQATTVAKKTQAVMLANRINKLLKEHDNAYGR